MSTEVKVALIALIGTLVVGVVTALAGIWGPIAAQNHEATLNAVGTYNARTETAVAQTTQTQFLVLMSANTQTQAAIETGTAEFIATQTASTPSPQAGSATVPPITSTNNQNLPATITDSTQEANMDVPFVVLVESPNSLSIIFETEYDISNFEIRTVNDEIVFLNQFPIFSALNNTVPAGTCLRFTRSGTNEVVPDRCLGAGGELFSRDLASVDVFWYDSVRNAYFDLLFYAGETQIKLCPAQIPVC